jgi:hypothetical protein
MDLLHCAVKYMGGNVNGWMDACLCDKCKSEFLKILALLLVKHWTLGIFSKEVSTIELRDIVCLVQGILIGLNTNFRRAEYISKFFIFSHEILHAFILLSHVHGSWGN